MSNKQNEGWNWNWEWKWDWNGAKDSMKEDYAKAHHHTHRKTRRHQKSVWRYVCTGLFLYWIFGQTAINLFKGFVHSLKHGFSTVSSFIWSIFTSSFRATSGPAIFGGLVIGIIVGLLLYKRYFNRSQAAEDEAEEITEEKEPEQIDPVPIPMTLGNTPSSSDEEYVPKVYNTFGE